MTSRLGKSEKILFIASLLLHLAVSIFLYSKFGERVLIFENEDAGGYISLAKSVVAGEGFSRNGMPTAVRTPGYPLVLAGILASRLPFVWSVLILQNLMVGVAVVLLYRIGKMLFSERVGGIAAIMYMIEPYMLMTANLATTETFFNFVLIVFAYVFLRWYVCANIRNVNTNIRTTNNTLIFKLFNNLILSAALLGVATLIRPAALYAPGVVFILLIIRWVYQKESWRWLAKNVVLFGAVFVAVLMPWMVREYIRFGTPRITNIDSVMLYFRVAPLVVAYEEGIGYTDAIQVLWRRLQERFPGVKPGDEYTDFRFYEYMKQTTKELLARQKALVFRTYAVSAIPALFGTGYEYMLTDVFGVERQAPRASYSEVLLREGSIGLLKQFVKPDIFQAVLLFSLLLWTVAYMLIFNVILRPSTWRRHVRIVPHPAPFSCPPAADPPTGGKGEGSNILALFFLLGFTAYFVLVTLGPAVHVRYRMPTFPWLFLLFAFSLDFLLNKSRVPAVMDIAKPR